MQIAEMKYTIRTFQQDVEDNIIRFTYPIQREGGQWDKTQKSLLIHSILAGYPIPALYALSEEIDGELVLQVLDGKQRLTTIRDFMDGVFYLDDVNTPDAMVRGKKEILAGQAFQDLSEKARNAIKDFSLTICKVEGASDDEIEDMFYRLNNGTPLSTQQKSKAKMGKEWAVKIQNLVKHNLITDKASFTPLQIRKAEQETALLQTMMLIDPKHELKSISSNDVAKYAETFRGDEEHKETLVKQLIEVMDYLDKAFTKKESMLLKKVHFPMTMMTAMKAKEHDVDPYKFSDWRESFKNSLKAMKDPEKFEDLLNDTIATDYLDFGGAGSVKREKTLGRVASMQRHLQEYLKKNQNKAPKAVEEPKKEEKKTSTAKKKDDKKQEEPKKAVATATKKTSTPAKKSESKPATATTAKKDSKVDQVKKNEADKKSAGTTA